jgi:hypothetical protein
MTALALKEPDWVPFVDWIDITEFCKPENVLAMVNARNKYGKYPITGH